CSYLSVLFMYLPSLSCSALHPYIPSFPTRRSSDLVCVPRCEQARAGFSWRTKKIPWMRRGFWRSRPPEFRAAPAPCVFLLLLVRSEEHTSELQSPDHLVCRLLLEKKK